VAKIRAIKAARESDMIVFVDDTSTTTSFDFRTLKALSHYKVKIDFFGDRLEISKDSQYFFTATYNKGGIYCYNNLTGKMIWHRPEFINIHELVISSDGDRLYCRQEPKICLILDAKTGELIAKEKNTEIIYDSHYEPIQLLVGKEYILRRKGGNIIASIKKETFAHLYVELGPGAVAITESGGDVRFCSTTDGTEIYRYHPPEGSHVLQLYYSEKLKYFYGIEWAYKEGGDLRLYRFEIINATEEEVAVLQAFHHPVFIHTQDKLLFGKGVVYDLRSGKEEFIKLL